MEKEMKDFLRGKHRRMIQFIPCILNHMERNKSEYGKQYHDYRKELEEKLESLKDDYENHGSKTFFECQDVITSRGRIKVG